MKPEPPRAIDMAAHKITPNSPQYDTHITRLGCCGEQPILFAGSRNSGFFIEGYYYFKCEVCERTGRPHNTSNGASGFWNDTE